MAKGRIIRFKFGNGNNDVRVTIEQARVVKSAMQEFKSGKNPDPYITINSELDGQAFVELNAIYGIFMDNTQHFSQEGVIR